MFKSENQTYAPIICFEFVLKEKQMLRSQKIMQFAVLRQLVNY